MLGIDNAKQFIIVNNGYADLTQTESIVYTVTAILSRIFY